MTPFTVEDQLAVVERLIVTYRWARSVPEADENRAYHALKTIAADLRARLPQAATPVLAELERRINSAHRSRTGLGYEIGSLRAIGENVLGQWPIIRLALTKLHEIGYGEPIAAANATNAAPQHESPSRPVSQRCDP